MWASPASILLALGAIAPALVAAGAGFTGKPVVSGFWASYGNLLVDNVPYSKYTHLNYFVFTTTPSLSLAGIYEPNIYKFVQMAHGNGTKCSMTVGGYTGSQYFSTAVGNTRNRTQFANTLVTAMNKYGFDGITIDWEYPNTGGLGNTYNSNDASNLVLLFQTLRKLVPNARLSMDAQVAGIVGPSGSYLTDLTPFVSALDYITIMAYDIFGFYSPETGPNSPLYACLASNPYSMDQGFKYYTGAGIPAKQIVMGFPAYAYAYSVSPPLTTTKCGSATSVLYQKRVSSDGTCGNYAGPASTQQYLYSDLINNKWVDTRGLAYRGSGFNLTRDAFTASVSIYSESQQLFIPFDDPTSAGQKGKFALSKGLAGLEIFDISGDTSTTHSPFALACELDDIWGYWDRT